MDKEKVKQYLRLDYDDSLIDNFILISESYLKDAIDNFDKKIENEQFKAKAEMVQLVLIQELYDNRNQAKKDSTDFSYVIRSMISQLQYWSE
jgi:DNA packaging protein, QLRG family|uniref:Head tail connector n=1 Tax=Siphoviridae sp. ctMS01 TaxID=2823574 RepID=A0A8S5LCZ7_9CAUD|nr:MAG TPA: head tail connector [Siphoviridae sp. ctMS01]DAS40392.1 MAG TPA: head tail connector [Caudoviricetes sp.]DAT57905.1 MAG TPA: head tail connector [Caudoviricetes sp.]